MVALYIQRLCCEFTEYAFQSSVSDQKTQCSVCWEDFVLSEEVRKLNCDHIFHEKCIFPWLELHGTCPICRKSQEVDGGGSGHDEQGGSQQFPHPQEWFWTCHTHAQPNTSTKMCILLLVIISYVLDLHAPDKCTTITTGRKTHAFLTVR